jgi:hypothetical protein
MALLVAGWIARMSQDVWGLWGMRGTYELTMWNARVTPDSANYVSGLAPLALGELLWNVAYVVAEAVALLLLVRKRRTALRGLFIVAVAGFVASLADEVCAGIVMTLDVDAMLQRQMKSFLLTLCFVLFVSSSTQLRGALVRPHGDRLRAP